MGAWDASAFGNDTAMDWVAELEQRGAAAVTDALAAAVQADEYLEAPEGEEALAAAEIVAASLGQPAGNLPDAVQAWVKNHPAPLSAAEVRLAVSAVERVNSNESELYELWVEDAQDPDWSTFIADLRHRLEQVRTAGS
jgi:hypothetical protein